ncbi:MAG: hypothetical protein HWE26_18610 [Alteromonadaceae bacterium]|nr:hypothetical protein [Alteromonadaceae bacterium]
MEINAILELLQSFLKVTSGISKLSKDSRDRVRRFLLEASETLVRFSEYRESNKNTYFECAQLSLYSNRLPKDVALLLGKERTRKLLLELANLYNSPRIPRIVHGEEVEVNEADILSLAGELKGIADTL